MGRKLILKVFLGLLANFVLQYIEQGRLVGTSLLVGDEPWISGQTAEIENTAKLFELKVCGDTDDHPVTIARLKYGVWRDQRM